MARSSFISCSVARPDHTFGSSCLRIAASFSFVNTRELDGVAGCVALTEGSPLPGPLVGSGGTFALAASSGAGGVAGASSAGGSWPLSATSPGGSALAATAGGARSATGSAGSAAGAGASTCPVGATATKRKMATSKHASPTLRR